MGVLKVAQHNSDIKKRQEQMNYQRLFYRGAFEAETGHFQPTLQTCDPF